MSFLLTLEYCRCVEKSNNSAACDRFYDLSFTGSDNTKRMLENDFKNLIQKRHSTQPCETVTSFDATVLTFKIPNLSMHLLKDESVDPLLGNKAEAFNVSLLTKMELEGWILVQYKRHHVPYVQLHQSYREREWMFKKTCLEV